MTVRELQYPMDTVTYLGGVDGSGFFWIGYYRSIPKKYWDLTVKGTYDRQTGYVGKIVICDTDAKGKYWSWYEINPDKDNEGVIHSMTVEGTEALLMGIFRGAARCYAEGLRRSVGFRVVGRTEDEIRRHVRHYRSLSKDKDILLGTGTGEYILQQIEDEAIVRGMCWRKTWEAMSRDEQLKYLVEGTKKLRRERYRKLGEKRYAKIKGRSVYHDGG